MPVCKTREHDTIPSFRMSEEQDALGSLSIATSSPVSPDPPSLYPIRQSSASGANWYLSDQDFSNPNEKSTPRTYIVVSGKHSGDIWVLVTTLTHQVSLNMRWHPIRQHKCVVQHGPVASHTIASMKMKSMKDYNNSTLSRLKKTQFLLLCTHRSYHTCFARRSHLTPLAAVIVR